jgi:ribosomal protein S18 acetylase RimI-like enzyme
MQPNSQKSRVHIREARISDAESIAQVRVDSWRTTYRGLLEDEYLENMTPEQYVQMWRNIIVAGGAQGYPYVVENSSGRIVGFILGGADRNGSQIYDAELFAIYLLEEYQGQGLGSQLVSRLAQRLLKEGYNSMRVWVLAKNPARAFYETLGGEYLYQKTIFLGGENYAEAAYGWEELKTLAATEES